MLMIQNILVSDDLLDERFACNLAACKGACCWEGDYGAPLEEEELRILADIYPTLAHRLLPAGRAAIEAQGLWVEAPDGHGPAATLVENGACAYLTRNEAGIALCGIEQAYRAGEIDWPKPISCHLYPIRVTKLPLAEMEALNYDRWDICAAACTKGRQENIRIFEFAKDALIRRYGQAWYEELEAAFAYREA